jgi:hypothetical protein
VADTKISALTAVTTPDTTDEFAVNQGGVSKRMTLAQARGTGFYHATDYGTDGTAIQAAIAAANAAGGGTVLIGAGTWSLGGTGLTIPGDDIILQGAGRKVTLLTYTGSGDALTNSVVTTPRTNCEVNDLTIDITGASAGAIAFDCENFYMSSYRNLRLTAFGTTFRCLYVRGGAFASGYTTYWNSFYDLECVTNSVCVQIGPREANANRFYGGKWEGNSGQSLVIEGTTVNSDTNLFVGVTMQSGGANFIDLQSGATDNTFFGCRLEPTSATTLRVQSGAGRNMFFATHRSGSVTVSIATAADYTVMFDQGESELRLDFVNNTDAKKTLQLRGSGAGITFEDDATANLYRRAAGALRTEGTFEAAGGLVAQQGAAEGLYIGGGGATLEAVGTDADIDATLDAKGAGMVKTNSINGATGGTLVDRSGGKVGFYGTTPVAKQTSVAVSAAAIHAALVNLGLISA